MDTYFLQHILPVICSTEWKKLKRVVIRGVGGRPRTADWSCLPPSSFKTWKQESSIIFENAEDRLKFALGATEVLWERAVCQMIRLD